ncbi:DUF2203 domain-containing protein [Granulicella arctica]|uniref:DUF2203 family protein n=1 Tax=Granulicella arctica TaxID=940613 RepID=A0A7Y9PGP6_9BACT|nr:DUF2203 domain-containing protein [Granulicella arctica]NYF79517.1 hypothetical protein [Granulicella arctica]
MSKTFTLNEAQTLLPVLEALLKRAQVAASRANELEFEMQQLSQRIYLSGGMHVDIVAAARRRAERDKAAQQAKDTLAEIDAIGVRVQDLEAGLLDFPCQVEGAMVLLCWKLGESAISHWHTEEEGFAGRKPLDLRFGKTERERFN